MEEKLSEKEKKLIELIRKIRYGKVVIHLQDGEPRRVEEAIRSIVL